MYNYMQREIITNTHNHTWVNRNVDMHIYIYRGRRDISRGTYINTCMQRNTEQTHRYMRNNLELQRERAIMSEREIYIHA